MFNPLGRTAEEIIDFLPGKSLGDSAYHFFQAMSWIDLAKRSQNSSLIQYAAIELRYGIEHLLFELLVMASESITEEQYQACIGSPKNMKRLLGEKNANYEKNAEFAEVIFGLVDPRRRVHTWKLSSLFKSWERASHYLHFVGTHALTHQSQAWFVKSIAELEQAIEPIWRAITATAGMAAMPPSKMVPLVRTAWEEFGLGKLTRDDLILRLKIAFPNGWITETRF